MGIGKYVRNIAAAALIIYGTGSAVDSTMKQIYQAEQNRNALSQYQPVQQPGATKTFLEWVASKYVHKIHPTLDLTNPLPGNNNATLVDKVVDDVKSIPESPISKSATGTAAVGIASAVAYITGKKAGLFG